jgi:O-antigen/teichoic acid export membrane protein
LIFADSSYHLSAQLLPFLFMGWVFDLFSYFTMLGVYKSQKSIHVLIILVIGTLVISLLNILLIPRFGIFGAAMSFCFAKMIMFFMTFVYLGRYFRISINWSSLFVVLVAVSVYCYLVCVINRYIYLFMLVPLLGGVVYYLRNSFRGLLVLTPVPKAELSPEISSK